MLKDWSPLFQAFKKTSEAKALSSFLNEEYASKTIYPPKDMIFQAFRFTNPKTLKAVIIGQDPYHNPGEAMGMSFSVPRGLDVPPSLINIYKEIENDLKVKMNFESGDLTYLATQGVLLLNAYLTVEAHKPLSHKRKEYETFLDLTLSYIDALDQSIVFFLWGSFARKYATKITNSNRLVLESVHPSPLSANRGGWFGLHQFSRANAYLVDHGVAPIDWVNR